MSACGVLCVVRFWLKFLVMLSKMIAFWVTALPYGSIGCPIVFSFVIVSGPELLHYLVFE